MSCGTCHHLIFLSFKKIYIYIVDKYKRNLICFQRDLNIFIKSNWRICIGRAIPINQAPFKALILILCWLWPVACGPVVLFFYNNSVLSCNHCAKLNTIECLLFAIILFRNACIFIYHLFIFLLTTLNGAFNALSCSDFALHHHFILLLFAPYILLKFG